MHCPLCGKRKGRRECPALNQAICSVCCGTKRLTEIQCPASCVHLASAREHPAAVVRRRQEQDLAVLLPTVRQLSERQHQLFFMLQSVIANHRPDGFTRLSDTDVADAAGAVAATLETAARGVLYDHVPDSLPARHLAGAIKTFLSDIGGNGGRAFDREASQVLRSIERGARSITRSAPSGRDYLELVGRLLRAPARDEPERPPDTKSTLILP